MKISLSTAGFLPAIFIIFTIYICIALNVRVYGKNLLFFTII